MTIRRTVPLRHVIGEGLSLAIGNVTSLRGRKGLGLAHAEFVRLRLFACGSMYQMQPAALFELG